MGLLNKTLSKYVNVSLKKVTLSKKNMFVCITLMK